MIGKIKSSKEYYRGVWNFLLAQFHQKITENQDLILRLSLIFWYIFYCFKKRINPWLFFQLNTDYYNEKKGLFSKLELDAFIPDKWKLKQYLDDGVFKPEKFPVFHKPEWGQNAYGIRRFDKLSDFENRYLNNRLTKTNYLVQEAAPGKKEFEVFYIRDTENDNKFSVLTITLVTNRQEISHPINSVRNPNTQYHNITRHIPLQRQHDLWNYLSQIGPFKIARVGLRADSIDDVLDGNFKIFEINLFTPMPINLLDDKETLNRKIQFIKKTMSALANITKRIPVHQKYQPVFFNKLIKHYRLKT
jgi:hypothetical protein